MIRATLVLWAALWVGLGGGVANSAEVMAVGQRLSEQTFTDQHDRPVVLDPNTRWVIFATDKKGADIVMEWLDKKPSDTLKKRSAIFVSDISRMPSLVTRMFALPALREHEYSVGLVREEGALSTWPRKKGGVAVMGLDQGLITQMDFANDVATLGSLLSGR